ncbi:MAG TPA: threonine--tRNA ligase [Patescibacteria group bacterium]|jgi:threonyl-tRNA synthetase|nr:threonine--tRNA ligase [Patescibacteria group bacterium]
MSTNSQADLENLSKKRHSLAHLLASSILEMYPKTQLGIGPVIDNGFYYDLITPEPIKPEDLPKLQKTMQKLAKANLGFERAEMSFADARKFFEKGGQPFKVELINDLETAGEVSNVSLYKTGEFIDLCRGGHVENTSEIDPESFKLDKIAGAYWRGDEHNPMMTRVYGLAFENAEELQAHLKMREEAEARDHKKLGPELDLFVFSDLVGSGLPLWTPKGTLVRNLLDDFVWGLRKEFGYEKVEIPHITKKDLYEKSGHWDKFKDELFRITTREGHEFAMKPMNCPHHTQIYDRKRWSYRDLPQRYCNTTMCYRDEQSGELSGLSRVRAFAQDDAHVFTRMTDAKQELLNVWTVIESFYKAFGFDLKIRLSLRDPAKADSYLGEAAQWETAESLLREIAKEKQAETYEGLGEAAFYGPKLDFMANDSLGREWQVATAQLDFNQPERFDLFCINENGEQERIVMVHAAIMGSIERFMSILIEHTAGQFPVWLSPVQAIIVPVSDKQTEFAETVMKTLSDQVPGLRIEIDSRSESMGKRIRESAKTKVPYILVVGDKEIESNSVAVRGRNDEDLGTITLEDFATKLNTEITNKS